MIDLHCHSTASDGSCSPAQIVAQAEKLGLKAVALTDHDTLAGLAEFRKAGEGSSVECIPGIELASQNAGTYFGYHIVGLFLQEESAEMTRLLADCVRWREERNLAILQKLSEMGVTISLGELKNFAQGEVVGRPHIAAALVKHGVVPDFQAAFERFLGSGKSAYVQRRLSTPEAAVAAIHSMGGVAIWAHPYTKGNLSVRKLQRMAVDLKAIGLDGIEADYAMHTSRQRENVVMIARSVGLLLSGGSDFHGVHFRNVQLGIGTGKLQVPDRYLDALKQCAAIRQKERMAAL